MKSIIFSPHCDDAALALGAAIRDGRLGEVSVVVVFSRSRYTIIEQDTANEHVATSIRIAEEKKAAEYFGYSVCFWDYPEPVLRSVPVFSPGREPELESIIMRRIRATIQEGALLFFPLGLGNHRDHELLNRAGLSVDQDVCNRVYIYEDLPYAGSVSIEELCNEQEVRASGFRPICLPSHRLE